MKFKSLGIRMLTGRLLTRSGDQAWDFAVPLVLLKILPGELRVAALYYFLVKLAHVILFPRLASVIDRVNRFSAAKIGIFVQLIGVLIGAGAIWTLGSLDSHESFLGSALPFFAMVVLVGGGILSSLGTSFMDIAIANDLVPSTFDQSELPGFNSRLRQIDLFTEVAAPIAAGVLLLVESPNVPLLGFFLIALWNVVSFVPEYLLLRSIFVSRPDLKLKTIEVSPQTRTPFLRKLTGGWRTFFREPVAPAVLAYALLWLSVLSPHGVLLTAFLKDGWRMPEWGIGLFRGLGAVFGLLSTLLFPRVIRKLGLIKGSQAFVVYQGATLLLALACFFVGTPIAQVGFLALILVSRVGLYGFSLGEMQIRQVGINPAARGEVNGFANALTGVATLGLYGAGTLLPSTEHFGVLVTGSVVFVVLSATLFTYWSIRIEWGIDGKKESTVA